MIAKGKPSGWTPKTELEHFMTCPVCGEVFDCRKLEQAIMHMHDGPEGNDRPLSPQGHRPPAGHQ
jgi:hypothetical protein